MNKFKIGDKVVYDGSGDHCSFYCKNLIKGQIYTVLEYSDFDCINLVEFPKAEILMSRFTKLIEEQPKINQMNNKIYHIRNYKDGAFQIWGQISNYNLKDALKGFEVCCDNFKDTRYAIVMVSNGVETIIEDSGEQKMQPPIVNGYKMKYTNGNKCIEFGCAKISIAMLAYISNSKPLHEGNRKIQSVTLDSGVKITVKQIEEIFNYMKHIDNKE
jgi:hypothetical protein